MKPIVAVFGSNRVDERTGLLAEALGRRLVDEGYRIVCGGLGGVMAAVACGARASVAWTGNEVIGLLPGWTDDEQPNPWVDIALATSMGSMRNNLVARVADAAIAVAGGAGTLSEVALAWHERRPLAALTGAGGWAERLAGECLDERRERPIVALGTVDEATAWLGELFPRGVLIGRGPTRWWYEQAPCLHRVHEGVPTGARVLQAELGLSLPLAAVVARLEALAERVGAWNHVHDQHRRALVTLDDGHVDALMLRSVFAGLPELQPVLFVTSALLVGDRRPLPLTALYAWAAARGLAVGDLQVDGIDRAALKRLPETEQRARLEQHGVPLAPDDELLLDTTTLRELCDEGWMIGSHGPQHCDLREVPESELAAGLVEARRLVQRLGQPPWLAWPEGRWDGRVASMARRAGFVLQFGLDAEPCPEPGPDLILRTLWRDP
ncbi:MAG: polysaccharide deacetylase family protein [Myxococcota bacterium]